MHGAAASPVKAPALPTLIPLDTSALNAGAENANTIPTKRTKKTRLLLIAVLLFEWLCSNNIAFDMKALAAGSFSAESLIAVRARGSLTDLGRPVKWLPMTLIHHQGIICHSTG
jgi:hypothetical protein